MYDVKEMQQTFHKLGEVFNAEYMNEATPEEIDKQIKEEFSSELKDKELKTESTELIGNIQNEVDMINQRKELLEEELEIARIKDSGFLEKEIKSLILSSKNVLQTLEKDIKIGSAPRMYEVYATLLNAITAQYKELRNLNESIAKFVIENKKQNLDEKKEEHKMMMDSNDALNMYMAAKNASQMDSIDADFDIVDEDEIKRE